jgi:hypothetical protein
MSEQYDQPFGDEIGLWRQVRDLVGNDHEAVRKIADQQIQKREAALLGLWEILIPVASNKGIPFPEDHHVAFRRILRELPGNNGTTSRPPGDGDWKDKDTGNVYAEKTIPIRFRACRADAERMAVHARWFYDQIEVMAYRIAPGDDIIIAKSELDTNQSNVSRWNAEAKRVELATGSALEEL